MLRFSTVLVHTYYFYLFTLQDDVIPNGVGLSAGYVRTAHTIHITTRNSATNKVCEGRQYIGLEGCIDGP